MIVHQSKTFHGREKGGAKEIFYDMQAPAEEDHQKNGKMCVLNNEKNKNKQKNTTT